MRLGYWSPLPPAPTGVADYSAALLPHLRKFGEIRLNARGDENLYHTGNNALHGGIYERALAEPGAVVIHDAVLQHFLLGHLDAARYEEEFVYNYGEWMRARARELWRERGRSGADARYFAYPMLRRIAEAARLIVVHNPAAARLVREHAPAARIVEIPHLFAPPQLPDAAAIGQLRDELGLSPATLLAGVFGHQRETKRLSVILRAFRRALDRGADIALLVCGEFASPAFERAVAPALRHPRILRTGHLPEPEFWRHLAATDVCLNLRYPSAAETSGVAIRTLGLGKVVVFTRDEAVARIPEPACLRVEAGPGEEELLAEYMVWLAADRGAVREIGRRAAAWIAREHAVERCAALYWDAISKM
jgi:glycosyltransferase involved in cell wall biosynthesis